MFMRKSGIVPQTVQGELVCQKEAGISRDDSLKTLVSEVYDGVDCRGWAAWMEREKQFRRHRK
jgi:hypothetical protein